MLVVDLFIVFKQQLEFASNFCPCAMMVITYLTSHFLIKGLFFCLVLGIGKGLILFTYIVNLPFYNTDKSLLQRPWSLRDQI